MAVPLMNSFFLSHISINICLGLWKAFPDVEAILYITKFFLISFLFLEVNCLYFIGFEYVEKEWVILNCFCLVAVFLTLIGSYSVF